MTISRLLAVPDDLLPMAVDKIGKGKEAPAAEPAKAANKKASKKRNAGTAKREVRDMEDDTVKLKDSLKVQDAAKIQMPSNDVENAPQKEVQDRKEGVDTSKGSPEAQGSAVMETPKKAVSKDGDVIRPLKIVAEIQDTIPTLRT